MTGRFVGSWFMTWTKPARLLAIYASIATILTLVVISGAGIFGILSLCLTYLFMSIMFPTIFALGIQGLGSDTKRGSSFIIMAIAGGAVCPPLMGWIADVTSMRTGFLVPLFCFLIVLLFAAIVIRKKTENG